MKQSEIVTGNEYRFFTPHTEHKKDMNGTIVKVVGRKKGKLKANYQSGIIFTGTGRTPVRFKLSNGRYANAGELKEISKH
jgi:hypothetical protein